jgi:hypothetical protein
MWSKASQVQKDKDHVFSHMWKLYLKDKHVRYICRYMYKYVIYIHLCVYVSNMFVIAGLRGLVGGRRGKENGWE